MQVTFITKAEEDPPFPSPVYALRKPTEDISVMRAVSTDTGVETYVLVADEYVDVDFADGGSPGASTPNLIDGGEV